MVTLAGVCSQAGGFVLVPLAGIWFHEDVFTFFKNKGSDYGVLR
jgi:hypothetical protein